MENNDEKLIDFFKMMNLYDSRTNSYIEKNKIILCNNNLYDNITGFDVFDYPVKGKLKTIDIVVPNNTSNISQLINIYVYGKAINHFKMINKQYKKDITDEIMPTALQRIYSNLYLKNQCEQFLNNIQIKKLKESNNNEALLLAYDLQFRILNEYKQNDIFLVPDKFYIDNKKDLLNTVKESLNKNYARKI